MDLFICICFKIEKKKLFIWSHPVSFITSVWFKILILDSHYPTHYFYFSQKVKNLQVFSCFLFQCLISCNFVCVFISWVVFCDVRFTVLPFLLTETAKFWYKDTALNCFLVKMVSVRRNIQIVLIWAWIDERCLYLFILCMYIAVIVINLLISI